MPGKQESDKLHEPLSRFLERGWLLFEPESRVSEWVKQCLPHTLNSLDDPMLAQWWRCENTWFTGVNALPNDGQGAVADGKSLHAAALDFACNTVGYRFESLDAAQVSAVYPGYPKPKLGESDSAFRYRLKWDAAHVDGLIPDPQSRRRFVQEFHAFILGIPMQGTDAGCSPLVVWEDSHVLVKETFRRILAHHPVAAWNTIDLTDHYHALRREVFSKCRRIVVNANPGQSYLLHRHTLHGISPWLAKDDHPGRIICYFRPEFSNAVDWLEAP